MFNRAIWTTLLSFILPVLLLSALSILASASPVGNPKKGSLPTNPAEMTLELFSKPSFSRAIASLSGAPAPGNRICMHEADLTASSVKAQRTTRWTLYKGNYCQGPIAKSGVGSSKKLDPPLHFHSYSIEYVTKVTKQSKR